MNVKRPTKQSSNATSKNRQRKSNNTCTGNSFRFRYFLCALVIANGLLASRTWQSWQQLWYVEESPHKFQGSTDRSLHHQYPVSLSLSPPPPPPPLFVPLSNVNIEDVNLDEYPPLSSWPQNKSQTHRHRSIAGNKVTLTPLLKKIPSDLTFTTTRNFSFCLLIKDDNDILNEWIAYHYHLWNLRQLIVAVDPSSQTSPREMLQLWHTEFGLSYELWDDDRYMPDFFLQGRYDLVPRMIKFEDKNATKWKDSNEQSTDELQRKLRTINNHRFRQAKFLQHCAKTIQSKSTSTSTTTSSLPTRITTFSQIHSLWTTHIDTDEYIALNPTLALGKDQQEQEQQPSTLIPMPPKPTSGSLLDYFERAIQNDPDIVNWPCISMPRILYGSVEDSTKSATTNDKYWNLQRFETIRWKYHADFTNRDVNKQPKVIMDVAGFPTFNVSKKAFSIHRPSLHLCRMQAQMNVYDGQRYPLVVHHYLGTLERYQARRDPRRTLALYHQKADIKDAKNENEWMNTWLQEFIKQHGMEKTSKVLWQYRVNNETHPSSHDNSANNNSDPLKPSALGKMLSLEDDSMSACLLVKDDNDILSEWIAYHHHVLKLRTLIVAVDPSSTTSPETLLEPWRQYMDDIELWTDKDYMPAFFLNGNYDQVPNLLGNMTTNATFIHDGDDEEDPVVPEEFVEINNHRFRQVSFLSSCVKYLKEQKKTWMLHIDTDEFVTLHPQVRNQDHWRQLSLDPTIRSSFLLQLLKNASREYSKGLSYPCVSMPRLLYGSKETSNDTNRFSKLPYGFNGTKFETLRWKYHSNYDEDYILNGKPKAILDLSGLPPEAQLLKNKLYSIHRPGLHLCQSDRHIVFEAPHRFPLTINHYIGSWERYSHRQDARRSRTIYDTKARVESGQDDDWIDGWVASFVQTHGSTTARRLLRDYTTDSIDVNNPINHDWEEDASDETLTEDQVVTGYSDKNLTRIVSVLAESKQLEIEFSACLLVKDDNEILNEWIAYHYHVLGLRYMIVAIDAKSHTSPTHLLDQWRQFGMEIEEWTDIMFMPESYFQKAYHLQPRLVKIKKNKNKWLEGIDDPQVKREYYNAIQDHRFRQITFLALCSKRIRDQGRNWMIHIDTDEYIVINPKLRQAKRFGNQLPIPPMAEASIIPRLLKEMIVTSWTTLNYPCISLPRLLYGSVEDSGSRSNVPLGYNQSRFESLRWKYHTDYDDVSLNKQPKVIMDVSAIPVDDKMFTENRVFSIHRPSQALCRTQGQMLLEDTDQFPFSVNHYLGTFERFNSREDARRNRKLYDQKANVTAGKDDDQWIDSWLPAFIEKHGEDRVSQLLRDYRIV